MINSGKSIHSIKRGKNSILQSDLKYDCFYAFISRNIQNLNFMKNH